MEAEDVETSDTLVAFDGNTKVRWLAKLLYGEVIAYCPCSVPYKVMCVTQ